MARRAGNFKVKPDDEKAKEEALDIMLNKDKGILIVPNYYFDGRYQNILDRKAVSWTNVSIDSDNQSITEPGLYIYSITKTVGNGWNHASVTQALTGNFNVNYKLTKNSSGDGIFVGLSTTSDVFPSGITSSIENAPYYIYTNTKVNTFNPSSPDALNSVDTGINVDSNDVYSIERSGSIIEFKRNGTRFNILVSSATYYLRVAIFTVDAGVNSLTISTS